MPILQSLKNTLGTEYHAEIGQDLFSGATQMSHVNNVTVASVFASNGGHEKGNTILLWHIGLVQRRSNRGLKLVPKT